jgi:hypothetical protein
MDEATRAENEKILMRMHGAPSHPVTVKYRFGPNSAQSHFDNDNVVSDALRRLDERATETPEQWADALAHDLGQFDD